MNIFIYFIILFCAILTAQPASAIHIEEVLDSIEVEIRAEVIAPCSFNLGKNYLSFSLKPDDSNSQLLNSKAQPIDFKVNCPYASKYHYAFQTAEVKTNVSADMKDCAKAFSENGDVKDFILFCIRDNDFNYYDAVTEVSSSDGKYFTGEIPKGSGENDIITDSLFFYPWDVKSASGKYTGVLTVVFFVE